MSTTTLRSWLYYRLSRDEDKEQNSLNNQKKILYDYAKSKGYAVIGESFDGADIIGLNQKTLI